MNIIAQLFSFFLPKESNFSRLTNILLYCLIVWTSVPSAYAQKQSDQFKFEGNYSPHLIGKRIAARFVHAKHALHAGKWISYPETFYWAGALKFAAISKDEQLLEQVQQKFEKLLSTEKQFLPPMNHVDLNMFGSLPLAFYQHHPRSDYKDLGMRYADSQWQVPADATQQEKDWATKGYSWQTRLWIDDMYMITIVQTQAYKVSRDIKYLDRAAKEMVRYLDELQRPNGLFYHAPDVPFYWSRGNGWMAAGMTELLLNLPKSHQDYPRIMTGYLKMMKSLKQYQQSNGLWNQLIDEKDFWAETSGSAMFTYAFINGVKQGWLGKDYKKAIEKAWPALVDKVSAEGAVSDVCVGTNKKNDKQYYYDRPRHTGDFHGQAPYLWCVNVLLASGRDN